MSLQCLCAHARKIAWSAQHEPERNLARRIDDRLQERFSVKMQI